MPPSTGLLQDKQQPQTELLIQTFHIWNVKKYRNIWNRVVSPRQHRTILQTINSKVKNKFKADIKAARRSHCNSLNPCDKSVLDWKWHLAETPLAKRDQRNEGFGKNALNLYAPAWESANRQNSESQIAPNKRRSSELPASSRAGAKETKHLNLGCFSLLTGKFNPCQQHWSCSLEAGALILSFNPSFPGIPVVPWGSKQDVQGFLQGLGSNFNSKPKAVHLNAACGYKRGSKIVHKKFTSPCIRNQWINRFWLNTLIKHYQTNHTHCCLIITNSWDTQLQLYPFFCVFSRKTKVFSNFKVKIRKWYDLWSQCLNINTSPYLFIAEQNELGAIFNFTL